MSISPSEEIAAAKWLSFGNINAYEKFSWRLYLPFIKSDTMMSTIDYHRRLDRNKVLWSEKHSGNIQLINNSDKGSGNTLQSVVKATGEESKVHSI